MDLSRKIFPGGHHPRLLSHVTIGFVMEFIHLNLFLYLVSVIARKKNLFSLANAALDEDAHSVG